MKIPLQLKIKNLRLLKMKILELVLSCKEISNL